jgi:hypothetical protein
MLCLIMRMIFLEISVASADLPCAGPASKNGLPLALRYPAGDRTTSRGTRSQSLRFCPRRSAALGPSKEPAPFLNIS